MKHIYFFTFALVFSATLLCTTSCQSLSPATAKAVASFEPPLETKSAVGRLHLEDLRDSDDPAVQAWIKNHNARTTRMLSLDEKGNADGLDKLIADRAREIAPTNPPPVVELNENQIFTKGGALLIKDSRGEETSLVAKVVHPDNGGTTVVSEFRVSPDGRYVAFAKVHNGLDINLWFVMELSTRKILVGPLEVRMSDFSWSLDSDGVFYTKRPSVAEARTGMKYAHNYFADLKTGQSKLVFVPPAKDKVETYGIETFRNSRNELQLVAFRTQGVAEVPNAIYLGSVGTADVKNGEFQVQEFKWSQLVVPRMNSLGRLISIRNGELIIRTSDAGNTFGLVQLNPISKKAKTLVPAKKTEVLLLAQMIGEKYYLQYLDQKRFHSTVSVHDLTGALLKSFKMSDLDSRIPNTGSLSPMVGHARSNSVYFTYSDVAQPTFTVKLNTKTLLPEKLPDSGVKFDKTKIEYKQSEAKSKDGTKVTYKVWTRNDQRKPNAIYLYYYGFIGIPQLGMYNKKFQGQLDLGCAVAIVTPRGGGEKGRDFQMEPKIDRFKSMEDIVAAAQKLKTEYPGVPIIASGRSFGGMMTMMLSVFYPQNFAGFSSVVPVSDVNEGLNRGLFGRFMGDDFGLPRDPVTGESLETPEWRDQLNQWNPLWNLSKLKAEDVKPIIIFSGANDERVGPEQARFFVQAFTNQFPQMADKIHLYEEPQNGHVGRTEFAQETTFIARILGLTPSGYRPVRKQ